MKFLLKFMNQERTPSVPGQPKRWYHFNDTDVEIFDPKVETIQTVCLI